MSLRRLAPVPAVLRRCVVPGLLALTLVPHVFAQSCTTTITGTVYAPNGTDPLPNILVYVPTTPVQAMPSGLGTCSTQSQLVSGNPLVSTSTDAHGNFTLTNPQLAGSQTIVIQAGKWRRQYPNVAVTACQSNAAPTLKMPANASEGDLPQIAISTGSADALECVFRKMGISDSEFQAAGAGPGHINFYAGSESAGVAQDAKGNVVPPETTLVSNPSTLNNYDMTLFACQGASANPAAASSTNDQNVVDYANNGGRVFATHFSYVWLNNGAGFRGVANWTGIDQDLPDGIATIDQSFYEGTVLAQWLYYIGASTTLGQIPLQVTRRDISGINPPAQSWARLNDAAEANPVMQFTFDTPLSAASGTPSVSVAFANSPSSFVTTDLSDSITITTSNTSTVAADSSLTLALTLPAGLTVNSFGGAAPGSGWLCDPGTLKCNRTTALAPGASDSLLLNIGITSSAPLGESQVLATLSGGGLSNQSQCGRVLFNEYHVETSSTSQRKFPAECETSTTMTAQEKFLEFSLYNLSNFIAPSTADTIAIQSRSTTQINTTLAGVTSPGPQTPIYYGQIIGDTDGVNAIISTSAPAGPDNGSLTVSVDNTVVCTLKNEGTGSMCPNAGFSGQNAGVHTVQASFSGDDDYLPSSSPMYSVTVLPDPTSTTVTTSGTPVVYGTAVTFTATVADQYATAAGSVNFFDGATLLGTVAVSGSGTAVFAATSLSVATHVITAVYVPANGNFLASTSVALTQVVNLPHSVTRTTLTSSANPSYQGQNISFSATVGQFAFAGAAPPGLTNPAPTGTVGFYDGTVLLGSSMLNASGVATISTSTLAVGPHSITAAYAGDSYNNASTSGALSQVVQPNTFTLTVSPTALNLTLGQQTTVTITVADNGNFNEPVQLSCSGENAETLCAFGSATIPPGGGTTTLSVVPLPPHPCSTSAANTGHGPRGTLPLLAGTGVLLVAFRRRKRLVGLLSFAALLALLPLLNGCSTSGCTDFGVLPGTYPFSVTATSAAPYAQSSSQTMTMVVKP